MNFDINDFSEKRLRNLYQQSHQKGFKSIFYGEEDEHQKFILWRHDVDIELPAVRKMAKIEAEEGIKSTYFMMYTHWFYNLFSTEAKETLDYVKSLGHKVALHCDLGVDRGEEVSDGFVDNKIQNDFTILEQHYGKDYFDRKVSFHNPPNSVLKRNFDNFYSAYQPKFFDEIKYLSDSNRVFREGGIEPWFNEVSKLSILLHPIIWAYKGNTMPELVREYLKNESAERLKNLEADGIII